MAGHGQHEWLREDMLFRYSCEFVVNFPVCFLYYLVISCIAFEVSFLMCLTVL